MSTRVAIVGLGVLGRKLFRMLYKEFASYGLELGLVADVNDTAQLLYLLKHDTVYGNFDISVGSVTSGTYYDTVNINGNDVIFYHSVDPLDLPIGEQNIQIVFDCTGLDSTKEVLDGYLQNNAKFVIQCRIKPSNDILCIVWGINQSLVTPGDEYVCVQVPRGQTIAAVSLANIVDTEFDINTALIVDAGSYTNLNNLQDSPLAAVGSTFQQGRAGAWNLITSPAPYIKGIGLIMPKLNGKMMGREIRSGTIRGNISCGVYTLNNMFDSAQFEKAWKFAAESSTSLSEAITNAVPFRWYVEEQLVSSDVVGDTNIVYCFGNFLQSDDTTVMINVIYDPITVQAANALAIAQYWVKK